MDLSEHPPEVQATARRLLAGKDPWAPDGPQNATEWDLCAASWRAIANARGAVDRDALIAARDALHRLCLERGSTDGYGVAFERINAALAATPRGAVER
jgi:hypothetical protein